MTQFRKISFLLPMSALLLFSACGNKKDNDKSERSLTFVSGELAGNYKAILRPMNTQVSGFLPTGAAEVAASDEKLRVKTYLEDDTKVMHIQDIREGTRCPTLADDTNKDGFVDIVEASKVVGPVLVALDGDLETHMGGQREYPRGGSFTYNKETDLDNVLNEFNDNFHRGVFQFENKVVLVHGTSDITRVPETVAGLNDLPRNLTIPIACGILKRK